MVRLSQPQTDVEPTPEFNEKCLTLLKNWEAGELPYNDVIQHIKALQQESRDSGHITNEARIEHLAGLIQHYHGSLNTSIRHYEQARKLYAKVGNRSRVANIDLNQGENYRFKGDFNHARMLYHNAYEAAAELGELSLQTIAVVNEGLTYLALNQLEDAERAFHDGYYLSEQWSNNFQKRAEILCELHYGMTVIHLKHEDYSAAWVDALATLKNAKQVNQPRQLGFAYRVLGEVVTHLDTIPDERFSDDPDKHFRASMNCFQEIDAQAELARSMFEQAKSLSYRGRKTSAARKLQQVMIIFTKLGMIDDAARTAEAQLSFL